MTNNKINDLCGMAWQSAVENVGKILGISYSEIWKDYGMRVAEIANKLHVTFDENGEIL